jgi:ribonuclease Z
VIDLVLLGTGSPMPDPDRAGPSTLVRAGGATFLVDAGRGVVLRLAAAGSAANQLTAVLVTHLHSDHITDLGDLITTRWVTTFEPSPLRIIGPPGTQEVVDHLLASLRHDISYRIAHHDDLTYEPPVEVTEVLDGTVLDTGAVRVSVAPTDHRPVEPSIAFRIDDLADGEGGAAVVLAGDTVPCDGLDRLCRGADALVHTVIRKDLVERIPVQRLQDILDYHSSVEQAAATAAKAGVGTLVLTHYVPAPPPGQYDEWKAVAATAFAGTVEAGDDLHPVRVSARATPRS